MGLQHEGKGDFRWASRSRVHGEWKTRIVRNGHELRTFAALDLFHFGHPFRHDKRAILDPEAKASKAGGI